MPTRTGTSRTTLPRLTTDLERAKVDIDEFGYAIVPEVLNPELADRLRGQVLELEADQAARGASARGGHPGVQSSAVMALLHYGQEFVDLAANPTCLEIFDHVLGPSSRPAFGPDWPAQYQLAGLTALILEPGSDAVYTHNDQVYIPFPWPEYPLLANVLWMVDEFNDDNGATLVVPGSHRRRELPRADAVIVDGVPVLGPKGSGLFFDARLWHSSGRNRTTERRVAISGYYCAPWVRPMQNHVVSLGIEFCASQPHRVRQLLGYDTFVVLGGVIPKGSSIPVNASG